MARRAIGRHLLVLFFERRNRFAESLAVHQRRAKPQVKRQRIRYLASPRG